MNLKQQFLVLIQEILPKFDFSQPNDYISDRIKNSFDVVQLANVLHEPHNLPMECTDIHSENFGSIDKKWHYCIKPE